MAIGRRAHRTRPPSGRGLDRVGEDRAVWVCGAGRVSGGPNRRCRWRKPPVPDPPLWGGSGRRRARRRRHGRRRRGWPPHSRRGRTPGPGDVPVGGGRGRGLAGCPSSCAPGCVPRAGGVVFPQAGAGVAPPAGARPGPWLLLPGAPPRARRAVRAHRAAAPGCRRRVRVRCPAGGGWAPDDSLPPGQVTDSLDGKRKGCAAYLAASHGAATARDHPEVPYSKEFS